MNRRLFARFVGVLGGLCLLFRSAAAGAIDPAARRAWFAGELPSWRVQRREELRRILLEFPHRDRWKWPALIDSEDPEMIRRANAGLRDTAREPLAFNDFVLAEKLFGDRLEPETREYMHRHMRDKLAEPEAWPYGWTRWLREPESLERPWGSQHYYAAMAGLAGGEVLNDPELFAAGRQLLYRLLAARNLDGEDGEYNSPGYTTFALTHCALMADYVDDPECRRLARFLYARMLLMQLSRYHPASQMLAGPYSRGYAAQMLGLGSFQLVLHDALLPGGAAHDVALARQYDGGYGAHRHKWWLYTGQVPAYVHRVAARKPFPYEVQSTSRDSGWNWRRPDGTARWFRPGKRDHTTYLTRSFAVSSSHDLYLYQPSGAHFLVHWPAAEPVLSTADYRVLWSWYARDDEGPFERKLHMRRGGVFRTLQHRNRVLAIYRPKDLPAPLTTTALRLSFLLNAFRPVTGLRVGGQEVRFSELPVTFPDVRPVFLEDGGIYAAILPLETTDLGRDCAMRISVNEHRLLDISYYNYRGTERTFSYRELERIRNGFAFEMAAADAYPDPEAFRQHMAQARVSDILDGDVREATFDSGGNTLRLRFNPFTEELISRQVNGLDVDYAFFTSTCAVLSPEPEIRLGEAVLRHDGQAALWLLKDPERNDYAVWNLSDRTVALALQTPSGTVEAGNLGWARLLLRGGSDAGLEVEELPGRQAQIRVDPPDMPMTEIGIDPYERRLPPDRAPGDAQDANTQQTH